LLWRGDCWAHLKSYFASFLEVYLESYFAEFGSIFGAILEHISWTALELISWANLELVFKVCNYALTPLKNVVFLYKKNIVVFNFFPSL
jgi:hypothetical protein